MIELIRELRRREVFRALGLYVGVCWLVIEVASILVPAFDGPRWIIRAFVIAAVVGFPVAGVLAWIYDITEGRIDRDSEHPNAPLPALGGRKMDFVVIGLLSVALVFSLYVNVTGRPEADVAPDPISVLIADFDNDTGEPLFDGVLEQALNIGIEGAPHVMSYERNAAAALAEELQPGARGLPPDTARLVAVREGIDLVLTGSIAESGSGYRLEVSAIDPVSGETLFDTSTRAARRDTVLAEIGSLAIAAREELGDPTLDQDDTAATETFTTGSLEAASAYVRATALSFEGSERESIDLFRQATELDPDFGRAWSGWANTEFKLGRTEDAEAHWQKALSLMSTMTERERLRTLGTYYIGATQNYEQAQETLDELVEKYAGDSAGWNNLAVASVMLLDFERAAAAGARALEMFPSSELYRANFALYAMYAGDFEAAEATAGALIEEAPDYGVAYLPIAIARLAEDDAAGARKAYEAMARAARSPMGASTAALGLADMAIYLGDMDEGTSMLRAGIERDLVGNDPGAAAIKRVALAETLLAGGGMEGAAAMARSALELSDQTPVRVAAALVLLDTGDLDSASLIGEELSAGLNTQAQAYAMMIEAIVARRAGEFVDAIQTLRLALDRADLWRVRYELGRTYLEGGFFAEAFGELQRCMERRGEATALFLDDRPTFRYLADVPYWLGRAQDGLGMRSDASENFRVYLKRRSSGPLAEDARKRVQ